MEARGIAVLSYHKYAGPVAQELKAHYWPEEEFAAQEVKLAGGETNVLSTLAPVEMKLAERATSLNKKLQVREIRKLSEGGHQVAIVSTHRAMEMGRLAAAMFARWSQENFFKYMRANYWRKNLKAHWVRQVSGAWSGACS